jgi:dihydrofolate reductase
MNAEWHRQNKMPARATEQQRLEWHLEHQQHCQCRPIPKGLAALAARHSRPARAVAVRRVRYLVAASLDGYIAGPKGEADWITSDPDIDFQAIWDQFDTFLIGRRTFEAMGGKKSSGFSGMKVFVFSRTLRQREYPKVTIVSENIEQTVSNLRGQPGKDIWLFGGGLLFRSLLAAGLVDTVEVAVVPVLLGGGIPLLPPPAKIAKLTLTDHKVYKAGIVSLTYAVKHGGTSGDQS